MSAFTASGARRSGDEYQDLQSAEILIEWLERPTLYRLVRLEAMDGSLDDIQAQHPDGSVVLLQIKFGVDATNEWTWEELTHQEASARKRPTNTPAKLKPSLLMKWGRSLADIKSKSAVARASVVTNRAASSEISVALATNQSIEFGRIPEPTKTNILAQLGGESEVKAFFDTFTFRFLDPSPDVLAEALLVRFVRLGGTREAVRVKGSEANSAFDSLSHFPRGGAGVQGVAPLPRPLGLCRVPQPPGPQPLHGDTGSQVGFAEERFPESSFATSFGAWIHTASGNARTTGRTRYRSGCSAYASSNLACR